MKLKNTLVFCLLFAIISFFGNLFISNYSVERAIFQSVFSTLTMGLLVGLVFPKVMVQVAKRLEKSIPALDLLPNENIVMAAGANHMKGNLGVGGKLTLTDQRLVFISHKFNIKRHREEFDRTAIASAQAHSIFEKGIVLKTKENVQHTFFVDGREQWISILDGN